MVQGLYLYTVSLVEAWKELGQSAKDTSDHVAKTT